MHISKPTVVAFVLLTTVTLAIPALAQDETPSETRTIVYQQMTEIDFEVLELEGGIRRGGIIDLTGRRQMQFNPLVRIRSNFDPEILTSVDQVR